ncbi:MAG TPA: imidazole glycerol phosphate synthase subunit HisH [Beijerinckiaceae bacterium]|nr:imidazole glycerol phosphate synthase subunit HisH [Beijerinckiaceae bacterium]
MKVALIDYGAGNLHSAHRGLERALADIGRTGEVIVTADPDVVASADRIVLPGDGAFRDCRGQLAAVSGLDQALDHAVRGKGRPFFGICVGMQLLADIGEEHGETAGLGWLGGHVKHLEPDGAGFKVPHMGWNTLRPLRKHPLIDGVRLGPDGLHAYFLHTYHLVAADSSDMLAVADYGGQVTAMVARGPIAGSQFHPEKSQTLGRAIFANFLMWAP